MNAKNLAADFNNLANLLKTQPGRLAEARQLAEEALAIKQTLDPGAAQIWATYTILAQIADQEAAACADAPRRLRLQAEAREHHASPATPNATSSALATNCGKHAPLIAGTVMGVANPEHRAQLEEALPGMEKHGWTNLVATIRRILNGGRDANTLCSALDLEDSMIIETILQGLADPSTLADLIESEPPETP